MGATYEKCGDEVLDIVKELLPKFHYDRIGVKDIRVGCVFYIAGVDKKGRPGPPLKLHGWPAQAFIKVNSLKLRAQGLPDVEITIDSDNWEKLTEPQRRALLDHELEHLDAKRNKKTGSPKFDDLDRPILGLRPHDYEVAGFDVIAERHGEDSAERLQAQSLLDHHGQYLFHFGGADEAKGVGSTPGKRADAFLGRSDQPGATMRINDGPEVPIDLARPREAGAIVREQMKKHGRGGGKRAAAGGRR